jgi:hypothetical protein
MFAPYDAFPEYIDTHNHGDFVKNKNENIEFINSAE